MSEAAAVDLKRAESGPAGVRVNSVSPGATAPRTNDGDVVTQMTADTPAGRPSTPEEIAAAAAWLLSGQAGFLHGAEILLD